MTQQYTLDVETLSDDNSTLYDKPSTIIEFSDNKEEYEEVLNLEHITIKVHLKSLSNMDMDRRRW